MASATATAAGGAEALSPFPNVVRQGLTAITFFAFLSLLSTTVLFCYLAFRLLTWKHRKYARINQYAVLLLNLILADLQQALAFCLSLRWVVKGEIAVVTPTCASQGWFLTAGDVSSAFYTLAMAVHLFADIVLDYRLEYTPFLVTIIVIWATAYFLATLGTVVHPDDFYMRAGMWCWINDKYVMDRLWLHYLWILLVEFGIALIYTVMFVLLWRRIRHFFYTSHDHQLRAESAAKSVVFYPLIYLLCTLPAVVVRLKTMAGGSAGYVEFTLIAAMITSNGWLDVLVYSTTRHPLIFGPAVSNEDARGLDTFTPWAHYPPQQNGPASTILERDPGGLVEPSSLKQKTPIVSYLRLREPPPAALRPRSDSRRGAEMAEVRHQAATLDFITVASAGYQQGGNEVAENDEVRIEPCPARDY